MKIREVKMKNKKQKERKLKSSPDAEKRSKVDEKAVVEKSSRKSKSPVKRRK